MTALILAGSDPDIFVRYVDIEAHDGEITLTDVLDEPERPIVRTLLAYTPEDAVAVGERLLRMARMVFADPRQMELI